MTDKELLLVFEAIRNHTVLLMTNWDQYMVLFADQQCLVEMKNGYPIFGNILHNTLYRDVVLGIARLLDPANQGKDKQHKNASLPFLKEYGDQTKTKVFCEILREITNRQEAFVKLRDKILAHSSVEVAAGTIELVRPDRETVSAMLHDIAAAVSAFHSAYYDSALIVMPLAGVATVGLIHNAQWKELGQSYYISAIDRGESVTKTNLLQPKFVQASEVTKDWWKKK